METFKTAQVAEIIGIHPNTVRLYEELELIPKAERRSNGYRVFTALHIEQFELARMALKVEVLQNGLRKKAIDIIKTSARCDFDGAIGLAEEYLCSIKREQKNAEEAILIAERHLAKENKETESLCLTRQEVADYLEITIDTLRNWEMNGLLTVKRRQNGYRVYTDEDVRRLKIIRSLRCANYSLSAILRLLSAVSGNPETDIRATIDTPEEDENIVSVCDRLITSLRDAEENARGMLAKLHRMKKLYK
ncbi:MAG: MerR family transcriptional regulator [Firmicutes bacterium HGW-Firmicutes-16]|nr:MAG: MerR family transcriptional regulator [Firmicutes bacterium HGW-Firmicutes-16]